METKEVKSYVLSWSGEDVRQHLEWVEDLENLSEVQWKKLYPYMHGVMEDVVKEFEDSIMEHINNRISDYISIYRNDLLREIKNELSDE